MYIVKVITQSKDVVIVVVVGGGGGGSCWIYLTVEATDKILVPGLQYNYKSLQNKYQKKKSDKDF